MSVYRCNGCAAVFFLVRLVRTFTLRLAAGARLLVRSARYRSPIIGGYAVRTQIKDRTMSTAPCT